MFSFSLAKFAFFSWFRTKGSIVGPLFFLALMFVIEGSFWGSVNGGENPLGPYLPTEVLVYSIAALTIAQMGACSGEPDALSEKIEMGLLDSQLLRPQYYLVQMGSIQMGHCFARLITFSPLLIAAHLFLSRPLRVAEIGTLLITVPLAGLINFLINHGLSSATFYFRESYAFVVAKDTLFWVISGTLVPLDLFPEAFHAVLPYFPPAYIVFYPVSCFMGRSSFFEVLFFQVSLCIFLGALGSRFWKYGVRRYQAVGG